MAFLFKKSPTANDRKEGPVSPAASYRGAGGSGMSSITSPLPPVTASLSSPIHPQSSHHSHNNNGISSIRSSGGGGSSGAPSTASPAAVAYGGAMAYERPLPAVHTSHSTSYAPATSSSSGGGSSHHSSSHHAHTSSYSSSHTPLPAATSSHHSSTLPSHHSTASSSPATPSLPAATTPAPAPAAPPTVTSSSTTSTLPPVAGAMAAPSTVSAVVSVNGDDSSHAILSEDEKMMMESKVTEEVLRMRTHFRSIATLSKRTFTIGATLGTGTFGRVRLCSYTPPAAATTGPSGVAARQNWYALKMLKKSEIIRLKQVEHIKAEKSILSRIAHPFIVTLYSSFQDDKSLYMLMEYVIGGELFSQLRKVGRFSNDTSRFYAAEIVLALQYLHNKNIVYRDLKPENLLIDSEGHIRITDFGFAKHVEDRTWTLCGTPEYLAPEIIQSRGHGKAVDWWALGILIYEMLAGYPPFYDENPFGIYQKILAGKIEFPKHFDLHARDLVKKLLTADRTKRFGCLKDGAEDIKRHRWFKNVDWVKCYQRRLKPPYVPVAHGANDTSNFDKYPDSDEHAPAPELAPKDKELFDDF